MVTWVATGSMSILGCFYGYGSRVGFDRVILPFEYSEWIEGECKGSCNDVSWYSVLLGGDVRVVESVG